MMGGYLDKLVTFSSLVDLPVIVFISLHTHIGKNWFGPNISFCSEYILAVMVNISSRITFIPRNTSMETDIFFCERISQLC